MAKLPSSFSSAPAATPVASTSEHPFAPENDFSATFDPNGYMPTIPGSPIGTFSPSSDNSGQRYGASMSPMSFPDLDMGVGATGENDWALDPSFFGGAAPIAEQPLPELVPSSSVTSLPAVLPPLPVAQQQLAPVQASAPVVAAPAPIAVAQPQPRAKRHLSASVTGEDEDDEEQDSGSDSDASVVSTRTSKRRPAAKKAKGSASGKPKTTKTSVAAFATPTLHHTSSKSTLAPVPEWTDKPDPETYKKLNSKEKRQLRNKISARNFRHRRKGECCALAFAEEVADF